MGVLMRPEHAEADPRRLTPGRGFLSLVLLWIRFYCRAIDECTEKAPRRQGEWICKVFYPAPSRGSISAIRKGRLGRVKLISGTGMRLCLIAGGMCL
jgi:hypothetical protein